MWGLACPNDPEGDASLDSIVLERLMERGQTKNDPTLLPCRVLSVQEKAKGVNPERKSGVGVPLGENRQTEASAAPCNRGKPNRLETLLPLETFSSGQDTDLGMARPLFRLASAGNDVCPAPILQYQKSGGVAALAVGTWLG